MSRNAREVVVFVLLLLWAVFLGWRVYQLTTIQEKFIAKAEQEIQARLMNFERKAVNTLGAVRAAGARVGNTGGVPAVRDLSAFQCLRPSSSDEGSQPAPVD